MRRSKRGDAARDAQVTEHTHVRREPIPSARAILWKPLPDSYHLLASMMRTTEQQTHLFITQRAFLQVERHLRSAPELELGGFLAGHLYECPRTHSRYSIVNTVVPFADVSDDPIGVRVTDEAYQAVRSRLNAHRLFLIGWYRNGTGLGLQLLPDDVETHLTYFDKPWQTTMLVLPDPTKPKGAFFTYDPRVGRSYCIPFYELFDGSAADAERLRRTCVAWKTYVPSIPVEPLPAEDREIVETIVRPIRNEPEPQPPEPIDEWWDAIKDPWVRLKDIAVTAGRHEHEPPPVVLRPTSGSPDSRTAPAETPPRSPASPRDQRTSREHPLVPRAAAPATPGAPPATPSHPVPPFVGPARPPARSPSRSEPVARAVEPQAPPAVVASPRVVPPAAVVAPPVSAPPRQRQEPRRTPPKTRAIPPEMAAAMERAATPADVALPPNFHDDAIRWQRRRRIGFTVAGVSFLAVIILSTFRSRPEQVAQAATTAAGTATTTTSGDDGTVIASSGENGGAPTPAAAGSTSLTAAVESLSGAIVYYRDTEEDHRRGLVGCRVLGRAHAQVLRARMHVDSSRSLVAGSLDAADSLRVSMLGAEYRHIAQMYRRSGCQS